RLPVLADVHRQMNTITNKREVMLVGKIAGNRAATHANIDTYFVQPELRQMSQNETLFIMVSDHGMPNMNADGERDSTFTDNCIDLWSFFADLKSEHISTLDWSARCLSKTELRKHLVENVSAGRVVFAMSQCFSGGFHRMSVDDRKNYPTADARICGFTAATEDTTASGCTADVDGPGYQGYERSFTEQLTGIDVVSGKRLRPGRASLAEAHRAATLEDLAKDIPLATSDFYLWKWALKIDAADFTPRSGTLPADVIRMTMLSTRIGDGALVSENYAAKEAFFMKMKQRFERMYPSIAYAFNGNIVNHRRLLTEMNAELATFNEDVDRAYSDVQERLAAVLGEWNSFVRSNKSTLSSEEREYEFLIFGNASLPSPNETALHLMSIRTITNPESADILSQYKSMRTEYALNWAMGSANSELSEFAQKLKRDMGELAKLDDKWNAMEKRIGHVRRLLIYREVLGAWNALAKMEDKVALKEVRDLVACESATLPR
ncbi:MAG TPA: hypothetical protein VM432_09980, partial [Bdellovibrionales bacterium]|nr:hypothetical protein [Bdellovibrionales bacterium]